MDVFIDLLKQKAADLGLPLLTGVLILIGFWILAKITKKIIIHSAAKLSFDKSLAFFFGRISGSVLFLFGVVTALGTVGINISALVAGLGLTGFALGFALKDTISNLLSGILILMYRPFAVGDRIKLAGYEGKVVSIDLRYTELTDSGIKILIPNAKLFTDPITVLPEIDAG